MTAANMENPFQSGYQLENQHDPIEFLNYLLRALGSEAKDAEFLFRMGSDAPFFQVPYFESDKARESPFLYASRCNDGMEAGIQKYLYSNQFQLLFLGNVVIVVVNREKDEDGFIDESPMPFESTWKFTSPQMDVNQRYNLRATINRHGALADQGHYFAHVKRAINADSDAWICCDDKNCQRVDEAVIFGLRSQSTVYALLYELQDDSNAPSLTQAQAEECLILREQELKQAAVLSDEFLNESDLNELSYQQLQLQLEARRLPTCGDEPKSELIWRLAERIDLME
jgi:hypothetical protein